MSFFSKIRGTFETLFQIGKGGPQVKNNGGNLDVRNPTDTGYVIVRGADPVGNNDLVTLEYFNANNEGAAGLLVVTMPLAQATKISSLSIPNNAIVSWCIIAVTTAYNGTTPTFAITRTGDPTTILQNTGDSDLTTIDVYEVPQVQTWGTTGTGTVTATFAGSGVTTGAATLYIAYSIPNNIS
jgi:hypothetical protein